MELAELAQYGPEGVSIALIIALVFIVRGVLKLMGNHMNHNTASNTRLADMIEQMLDIFSKKL